MKDLLTIYSAVIAGAFLSQIPFIRKRLDRWELRWRLFLGLPEDNVMAELRKSTGISRG